MNGLAREIEERKLTVALVRAYEGTGDGPPPSLAAAAAAVGLRPKRAAGLLRRYKVQVRDRVKRQHGAIPSSLDPRTATTEDEAADRRAALAAFAEGLTVRELAAMLGTSLRAVSCLLRAAGIVRRRGRPAKTTAEEVARLRASRFSYQEIADVLGLSRSGVAQYRDGQSVSRRIDPTDVVKLRDVHRYGWDDIGRHLDCHRDTARKAYYKAKRAALAPDQPMLAGSVGCSEQ